MAQAGRLRARSRSSKEVGLRQTSSQPRGNLEALSELGQEQQLPWGGAAADFVPWVPQHSRSGVLDSNGTMPTLLTVWRQ